MNDEEKEKLEDLRLLYVEFIRYSFNRLANMKHNPNIYEQVFTIGSDFYRNVVTFIVDERLFNVAPQLRDSVVNTYETKDAIYTKTIDFDISTISVGDKNVYIIRISHGDDNNFDAEYYNLAFTVAIDRSSRSIAGIYMIGYIREERYFLQMYPNPMIEIEEDITDEILGDL